MSQVCGRTRNVVLKCFGFSAGVILAVAGIAKIWSAFGTSKVLGEYDPIVGAKFRLLMLAVGILETAIALVCFFRKRQALALSLVAWISTNFMVYRLGLWWLDWRRPCGCLGSLTDAIHISPQAADKIMKVLLAYLLVGSYSLLFCQWRQQRRTPSVAAPRPH